MGDGVLAVRTRLHQSGVSRVWVYREGGGGIWAFCGVPGR